jgi:hypothetical protein
LVDGPNRRKAFAGKEQGKYSKETRKQTHQCNVSSSNPRQNVAVETADDLNRAATVSVNRGLLGVTLVAATSSKIKIYLYPIVHVEKNKATLSFDLLLKPRRRVLFTQLIFPAFSVSASLFTRREEQRENGVKETV